MWFSVGATGCRSKPIQVNLVAQQAPYKCMQCKVPDVKAAVRRWLRGGTTSVQCSPKSDLNTDITFSMYPALEPRLSRIIFAFYSSAGIGDTASSSSQLQLSETHRGEYILISLDTGIDCPNHSASPVTLTLSLNLTHTSWDRLFIQVGLTWFYVIFKPLKGKPHSFLDLKI